MKNNLIWIFILSLLFTFSTAYSAVLFEQYPQIEFSPKHGQIFKIPLKLAQDAEIALEILTSDGNLVTTIKSAKLLKAGSHVFTWDGKDSDGQLVPDEAYVPVIKSTYKDGSTVTFDPRDESGGEVLDDLNVQITSTKDISYILPAPSRVLIRAGIKGGPMLRSLANWSPHSAGKNIQRWDGYDNDHLFDLRKEKDLSVLVTAFKLPEHTIITKGNKALSYRDYYKKKGWEISEVSPEKMILSKNDIRISRHYYSPRSMDSDPRVDMVLKMGSSNTSTGLPVVQMGQYLTIQVDIPKKDRWLMNESLYEVAFFIDKQFTAEEEQGFVPLSWVWKVTDLKPGKHIITTNVSGFSGKVGVTSIAFIVNE